jgi:hypothetical protein
MVALAAFIGPALGLAGSLFGASGQAAKDKAAKKAAAAQNAEQKKIAEAQYARAQEEYELKWQENLTKYYWEQAQVEQIRQVEAQAAVDQATVGARLIWGAAENYMLGAEGLFDKFRTQENLRQTGVSLEYRQAMTAYSEKTVDLGLQTRQTVANYLTQTLQNGMQAEAAVNGAQAKVDALMTNLTNAEMIENYKYNAAVLMAAMDGSVEGNARISTSGGGNTAKAGAMNAAKRGLTEYAGVHLSRQGRMAQVGQIQSQMTGELSAQLAGLAVESQGYVEQTKWAIKRGESALTANEKEAMYTADVFDKLTIPSFKLANDQYKRELKGLQLGTMDTLFNATLPYRQREVFDPLKPQKGIAPTYYAPTPVAAQTGGFYSMASAALQGASSFSPTLFSSTIPNLLSNLGKTSSYGSSGASNTY